MDVLSENRKAIGWHYSDLKGISPTYCLHKILLEDGAKPFREGQRRLNPHLHEVVREEIIKLFDAKIIFPISDNKWVSALHVVPKKSGITVEPNEKGELISKRVVNSWRVCVDYRKLNLGTRKDHFPLPHVDQMLERLAGHEFYYFLDGFYGYNQIIIVPAN